MANLLLASELNTKRGRNIDMSEEVDRVSSVRQRSDDSQKPACMIKFLVSNNIAGSLIGKGGAQIIELQKDSKARIMVSQSNVFYPGTLERSVVISGTLNNVCHAQTLIWNKIAQQAAKESGEAGEEVNEDEAIITGKLLIPTLASGLVIGRGGANIRMISESSGARIQLSTKEDSRITQERIMTVTGTIDSCVAAVSSMIEKLIEDEEVSCYVNPSTSYERMVAGMGFPIGPGGVGKGFNPRSGGYSGSAGVNNGLDTGHRGRRSGRRLEKSSSDEGPGIGTEAVSASTTINMHVPDNLVGSILGARGSTMMEIMRCTGAKVTVSPRGEGADAGATRDVTIVGTPQSAQSAYSVIAEKIKQQSISYEQGRGRGRSSNA